MPDRETVIKGLQNLRDAIATDYIHEADQAVGTIDNALSLLKEQEAKRGKWIPVTNGRSGMECSICHDYAPNYSNGLERLSLYCPNCGAKMKAVKWDV